MLQELYSNKQILVNERKQLIVIRQQGEKFYTTDHEDCVFHNATLSSKGDTYVIAGVLKKEVDHTDISFSLSKMRQAHPEDLIEKHNFLGLFYWYSSAGVVQSETRTRYILPSGQYRIAEQLSKE